MSTTKTHAERAAASLATLLKRGTDPADVAAIIDKALQAAVREQKKDEQERLASAEAAVSTRASRLLSASPAVIYSFKARDDFAATFVSGNISRLFGYEPSEYLNDLNFWREHVHPEDLPRIEADVNDLFESGQHALEYRFLLLGE
jgi:adenylate cyclase